MFSILSDFIRNAGRRLTLIVLDEDGLEEPRRYQVLPSRLFAVLGAAAFTVGIFFVLLVVATPIRGLIPGLATEGMRQEARRNAVRLQTVEDSLAAQDDYLAHLRNLVMGQIEPGQESAAVRADIGSSVTGDIADIPVDPPSTNWEDHEQPALPVVSMPATGIRSPPAAPNPYLASLQFPMLPPVTGLFTRGFDARAGHFAIDLAVTEGTVVRAVGDGYVILADWTHDGGHVVAVQHANGFVSVYKHNEQLLKRVGDRVRDREAIALSGNTGEITTGPHLHFELWHDGLAQDPSDYLISL